MAEAARLRFVVSTDELSGANSLRSQSVKVLLREIDWAKHTASTKWTNSATAADAYKELVASKQLLKYKDRKVGSPVFPHDRRSLKQVAYDAMSYLRDKTLPRTLDLLHKRGSEALKVGYLERIGYNRAREASSQL